MPGLPLRPAAIYGLIKETRPTEADNRPLVVAGARELAPVLARELARGGDAGAVREGGTFERPAVLVYVASGALTEVDERELAAARKERIPIVLVALGPGLDEPVPDVLATSIVHVPAGSGFPLPRIAEAVAGLLGEDAVGLAARLPVLRRAVSDAIVSRFSRQNGLIGAAVFVPGADFPVLTLNQLRLVLRLARAHGLELGPQRFVELAGVVGGGLGFRALARQLLGVVPVAGWAVKGGVAYGGTKAVGEAATRYFESATPQRRDSASPGGSRSPGGAA
jgi:uncharacterized protein (DUF697 family)